MLRSIILGVALAGAALAQPISGLGKSTSSCVDRDGDGYGVGPGCTGVDVDDLDATIHTAAEGIAKYGTLAKLLAKLGYSPLRIWYVATTGDDATCKSGSAPVGIGSPCASFTPVASSLAAGDMVLYREGTYTSSAARITPGVSGTSANPIVFMAYPGETVWLDMTATSFSSADTSGRSYIVIDGIKAKKGYNNGCLVGGSTYVADYSDNPTYETDWTPDWHHITYRHLEVTQCKWGLAGNGWDYLTVEDSFLYDMGAGQEHCIYFGARYNTLSQRVTIRRNIIRGGNYTGVQLNGNIANALIEQNLLYNSTIANLSWENGVHDSIARGNILWGATGGTGQFILSNYNGRESMSLANGLCSAGGCCGADRMQACVCTVGGAYSPNEYSLCAHDQTNNLIENNTVYGTSTNYTAVGIRIGYQDRATYCTTPWCQQTDLGHNTFRNNVLTSYGQSGYYMPLVWNDGDRDFPTTSTVDHNVFKIFNPTANATVIGWGYGNPAVDGHGTQGTCSYGYCQFSCATAAGITNLSSCFNSDPKFAAADPTWVSSMAAAGFDFSLTNNSPAIHAGSTATTASLDVRGRAYASDKPSIGAYEVPLFGQGWTSLGASSGVTTSICPANGYGGSVTSGGNPYLYNDGCHYLFTEWSGGFLRDSGRTAELYIWGGGHGNYGGNELYKVPVNSTARTASRVTNPSTITAGWYGTPQAAYPDGNPTSRHTYAQMAYIPTLDKTYVFSGGIYPGGFLKDTWMLDVPTLTWTAKDPTVTTEGGVNEQARNIGGAYGATAYDHNSGLIFGIVGLGDAISYDPVANKYLRATYTGDASSEPNGVIDTSRRMFWAIGHGKAYRMDISAGAASTLAAVNVTTSMDASCSTLMASWGPGLAYNPTIDRIVGYPSAGGNTVYFMDPATMVCTTQAVTGGPSGTTAGLYGRFAYAPSLDTYVVAPAFATPTYALNLNADTVPTEPGGSPPTITTAALAHGAAGTAYSQAITTANSPTCSAPGLPPGLSFADCVLTGTPTTAGMYSFTVTATNGAAPDATRSYSVNITGNGPARILSGSLSGAAR